MKIGRLEIRRAAAATEPAPPRPDDELGASGTVNLGGFLSQDEYNPALRDRPGLETWERMLRSDDAAQEVAGHITAPILNANWDVEPAGEEPQDLEAAAAVRKAYFEWLAPNWGWQQHLDEALDHLFLGHYVFETVWQVVEDELEYGDPNGELQDTPTGRREKPKVQVPRRQFIAPKRFAPRLPKTIKKWNEEDGDLVSITQQTFKDGDWQDEIVIPIDDLLLYTHRMRGNDWTGRSLFRGAYKAWTIKELLEKILAIAAERHGVGTWVGYVPEQYKNDSAMIARIEAMFRDIRSGANSYMVFPGPKQAGSAQGADGFLAELISPTGQFPDLVKALEFFRGAIKGSALIRFSELGHGQTGARSTSDSQSEIWYDALHATANYISEVHQPQIRRFCDANYSGLTCYPRLVASDIESKNLAEFAESIARLTTAGALEMDRSARATVRKTIDFPDEDDPEKVEREAEEQKQLDQQVLEIEPLQQQPPTKPRPPQ